MMNYTVDRTDFGPGPWNNEPDEIWWQDVTTGYSCLVRRNGMGALCGYVAIPQGHPWYNIHYDEIYGVDVHGGLTFSGSREGFENTFWVGFDCGHWGDLIPGTNKYKDGGFDEETYKTVAYVQEECARLCQQIKEKSYDANFFYRNYRRFIRWWYGS